MVSGIGIVIGMNFGYLYRYDKNPNIGIGIRGAQVHSQEVKFPGKESGSCSKGRVQKKIKEIVEFSTKRLTPRPLVEKN